MRITRKGLSLRTSDVYALRKAMTIVKEIEKHGISGKDGAKDHAKEVQYPLKNLIEMLEAE